jgi:hypothetical protein
MCCQALLPRRRERCFILHHLPFHRALLRQGSETDPDVAEEASANNYTVRQLKGAADDLRVHKDDHDPGKEIIKTLDQPVPVMEDPDLMALCTDKDRVLEELSKAERKKIRALIKERKPGLDEWKKLMETFEGILSDLEDE